MTDVPREERTRRGRQLFDAPAAKPPYRVPSMTEVAAVPWNGLTVASLFAGCGGSSLGYRMAGFRVVWASEFVPAAQDSYRANMAPGTVLDGRDVRLVKPGEILDATGLALGDLDLLDGSPPCQAFSTAGRRDKGWGQEREYAHGAKQRNEDLFWEYVRIRDGLMPRTFVAENVSGLVKGVAKGYFVEILRLLKKGYRVEARLLDAQWLGVPQARQRIIFVGVREDLGLAPAFPSPLPHRYSVRDALPWLGRVVHDTTGKGGDGGINSFSTGVVTDRPAPTITNGMGSINSNHFKVTDAAPLPPSRLEPGAYGARDVDLSEPCPTVTCASPGNDISVSVRKNSNASHADKGRHTDADEPAPAVMSRRPNLEVAIAVVQPSRGKRSSKTYDLDQPMPTLTAGVHGSGPHDVQLEQRVVQKAKYDREVDVTDTPALTVRSSDGSKAGREITVERRKVANGEAVGDDVGASLDGYAVGAEYDRLNPGQASGKFFNLVRADAAAPCPTVTSQGVGGGGTGAPGGVASVCHPTEKRKFTIAELRRICGFPDDFVLTGSYSNQWERLGNAVPPVMCHHIASAIRDKVLLPWHHAQKTKRRSNTSGRAGSAPRADASSSEDSQRPAIPTSAIKGKLKSPAGSPGRSRAGRSRKASKSATPATTRSV